MADDTMAIMVNGKRISFLSISYITCRLRETSFSVIIVLYLARGGILRACSNSGDDLQIVRNLTGTS